MRTTRVLLAIAFIGVFLLPALASSATEPERDTIMWATGYDNKPENCNPFKSNPFYGKDFCYETLFGLDTIHDNTLIPQLGVSYEWNDDGTEMTVTLTDQAVWSDGEALDADDVVFSYLTARDQSLWADMKTRITAIEKVDAVTVKFTIAAAYAKTGQMINWLCGDIPIVPEHVWADLVADNSNADGLLDGDWLCDSFEDGPTVFSGPYKPYLRSDDKKQDIYVRNDDWWGAGVIHQDLPDNQGAPKPQYIGHNNIADNTAKDTALLSNAIDLHAGFYKNVLVAMAQNENIETYYGRSPTKYYIPGGSIIYVAPNLNLYPFSEIWFRSALAWAIDYDSINTAASGNYWAKAKIGALDNASAAHLPYFDETVENTYGVKYDLATASAKMGAGAFISNATNPYEGSLLPAHNWQVWRWFTKDTNATQLAMPYYGLPSVTVGSIFTVDALPAVDGYNIPIVSPIECIVPAGWSDVVLASQMWQGGFAKFLNITAFASEVDTGILVSRVDAMDFQFLMQCCGPKLGDNPLTFMTSYIGTKDKENYWGNINVTQWRGAAADEYVATFKTLETKIAVVEDGKEVCTKLATILGQNIPAIPVFVNGFWYTVNTLYWDGWIQNDDGNASGTVITPYQPPVTSFTNNLMCLKQRLVLNLVVGGGAGITVGWSGLEIASLVGVIGVISFLLVKRKHD